MIPTLTILGHPDARRVGQVARLEELHNGRPATLSRSEPRFATPGESAAEPLADPALSRRAVTLSLKGDRVAFKVDGAGVLALDGAPAKGVVEVPASALAEGVVLELGGRVTLLLHRSRAEGPRAPRMGIVGDSDGIERVRADIARVADLDAPVLIRGASGTGKELVARAIHKSSRRRAGPCVCVDIASVPASQAASELFGQSMGASSKAARNTPGHVARADGGTLFLDRIGDLPAAVQPGLLRALQAGEVTPVGASAPARVSVRLVAATDVDLAAAARDGRFEAALYEGVAGFEITLPPLRARRDDIGRLFVHFLRAELISAGEPPRLDAPVTDGRPYVPAALAGALARYDWPGNVRELRALVRQLVQASRGEPKLVLGDTIERLVARPPDPDQTAPDAAPKVKRRPSEITDDALLAALRGNGWRREATARQLGIAVSSLYGLIDRCALLRKANELSREELERCRDACGGDLGEMSAKLEVSTRGLQLRMRELGIA